MLTLFQANKKLYKNRVKFVVWLMCLVLFGFMGYVNIASLISARFQQPIDFICINLPEDHYKPVGKLMNADTVCVKVHSMFIHSGWNLMGERVWLQKMSGIIVSEKFLLNFNTLEVPTANRKDGGGQKEVIGLLPNSRPEENAETVDEPKVGSDAANLLTHPLQNKCKYAVLNPFDKSISGYVPKVDNMTCQQVLPDFVELKDGFLTVDQKKAHKRFHSFVVCRYAGIGGTVKPANTVLTYVDEEWFTVVDRSDEIFYDQIEVQCSKSDDFEDIIYNFAFAHVPRIKNKRFSTNTETKLSVNIIMLDSTSMNAFRRHMPQTWDYFVEEMGALHLDAYFKVADNTIVNLVPLLTGLRYGNQWDDMPSDYPLDQPINLEQMHILWKEFQDKKCATFLSDDPVLVGLGLFQYPHSFSRGFAEKPTDYWYRPYQVYQRKYPVEKQSKMCYGNEFNFDVQLRLLDQMSKRYSKKCYFALSQFAEISHDDCAYLELLDAKLRDYLKTSWSEGIFNKTALIIMGDHGQRISALRTTMVGRIEERTPMFAIWFPEWFRKKHPDLMRNFQINQNRLTSHFDMYQVLKDISDENFDGKTKNDKFPRQKKGMSLLHNVVPLDRTCQQANVPESHCACLIPADDHGLDYDNLRNEAREVLLQYHNQLSAKCTKVNEILIRNVTKLTMSQLILHGVRNMEPAQMNMLKSGIIRPSLEYFEVLYSPVPSSTILLSRLQKDLENQLFFVNVEPMVLDGKANCLKSGQVFSDYCKCINNY